jgi:ATP-dependent helicase/nuclease subunit A
VRGADLIAPRGDTTAARARLEEFRARRASTLRAAAVPQVTVATVTAASHALEAPAPTSGEAFAVPPDVGVASVERAPSRPEGPRFGTLVHQTLATVELSATEGDVARVARAVGRLVGATEDEIVAAGVAASCAMRHPILERARQAEERGEARREVPITLFEEGALVEGVVDLAFREDGRWLVVDFKTDRAREGTRGLPAYVAQVRIYARAIERATGEPAGAMLLFV